MATGVIPDPDAETLADIAIQSGTRPPLLGSHLKVAMISYSTGESGSGADVDKVRAATKRRRSLTDTTRPLCPTAKTKALTVQATVFIFAG